MSKDPLYSRPWKCAFDGEAFDAWLLYSTARDKIQKLDELLDVAYYAPPPGGGPFVDYGLLEVKVCPRCLFASPDAALFDGANPYVPPVKFEEEVRRRVIAAAAQRRTLVADPSRMAARDRTIDEALVAARLSVATSTTLHEADPRTFGGELVRAANIALRAARMCGDAGRGTERAGWMRVAHSFLLRAKQADLKGPVLYKSLYQLGVLGVLLGDDKTTSVCFTEMNNRTHSDPARELSAYYARFRRVWQDRDEHRAAAAPGAE